MVVTHVRQLRHDLVLEPVLEGWHGPSPQPQHTWQLNLLDSRAVAEEPKWPQLYRRHPQLQRHVVQHNAQNYSWQLGEKPLLLPVESRPLRPVHPHLQLPRGMEQELLQRPERRSRVDKCPLALRRLWKAPREIIRQLHRDRPPRLLVLHQSRHGPAVGVCRVQQELHGPPLEPPLLPTADP